MIFLPHQNRAELEPWGKRDKFHFVKLAFRPIFDSVRISAVEIKTNAGVFAEKPDIISAKREKLINSSLPISISPESSFSVVSSFFVFPQVTRFPVPGDSGVSCRL